MVEEFLYVQSTPEQIIAIPVALGCIKALGTSEEEKRKDIVTNTKCLTALILNSLKMLVSVFKDNKMLPSLWEEVGRRTLK